MCHFISAVLPGGTNISVLRPTLDDFGMSFTPLGNRSVEAQLPPGVLHVRATNSHCDCGTALGELYRTPKLTSLEREKRRHRESGWSEARLMRWETQKRAAYEDRTAGRRQELSADLERWRRFLDAILGSGLVPCMGVLIHFYSGALDTEVISFELHTTSIHDVDEDFLKAMREDVLYGFLPDKRPCTAFVECLAGHGASGYHGRSDRIKSR